MSDTTAAGLTEAEREALDTCPVCEHQQHWHSNVGCDFDPCSCGVQWSAVPRRAFERILADRLAAVQAELEEWKIQADINLYRKRAQRAEAERDAARAEVEALRERVGALADEYVGVVAMTERSDRHAAGLNEFRQVIADLRAALEAER